MTPSLSFLLRIVPSMESVVRVLLILLGGGVAHRSVHPLISHLDRVITRGSRAPESVAVYRERVETLEGVLHHLSSIIIWGLVVFMVLSEFGVDITPLIASAGIVGLAIGFGSQQLVRDFLSGFFILLENQYAKGDLVEIAGKAGKVEEINLRTTVLRSEDGKVHIIPNSAVSIVTRSAREPH